MTGTDADLTAEAVAKVVPGRPLRAYPAMLSTEADALAWARSGGPSGALVVADYQASPRGRGGRPWATPPGRSLGFSVIVRPDLTPERAGWPYVVVTTAVADVLADARIAWPDRVHGEDITADIAVQRDEGPEGVRWVVVSCLFVEALPPRGPLLARAVNTIESWFRRAPEGVLAAARSRCETLGRRVRVRIVPVGPRGVVIDGVAADLDEDGSLVVETTEGRRRPVAPQDVGVLEVV